MLDQNTDRMWYVIGAILIGAALLFGFNTFIPNAFASVGDSFTTMLSSTKDVTERHVDPNVLNRVGIIENHWIHMENIRDQESHISEPSVWYGSGISAFVTDFIPVEPGIDVKTVNPIGLDNFTASFVTEYDADKNPIRRPFNRNEAEEMTYTLSDNTQFIRFGAKSEDGRYVRDVYRLELLVE